MYYHAKFGGNWTTNKGETEGGTMITKYDNKIPPSLYDNKIPPSLYDNKIPQPE